ncbi:integrase family protein [Bradyrhizobium sp. BWC-3-1]|uniref:tyrosine-type recombinase/integrase n=1 Tax=Bradyrhizobium sp. BWC-3-1 TaxID=3080012 RepID=UPI00293ECBAC|nr:integrase family protein [Bradyrhizobium sp. BWC-3-1]WOH60924.1 integrase family protein [Bradyrhizobium sp. BWC-3-1]
MSSITTNRPASKAITPAKCEARVTKQTKTYDGGRNGVPGLYVSVTPKGVATFNLKFSIHGKGSTIKVGIYHPELFTIEMARIEAMKLKWRIGNGEDVLQAARQAKQLQAKLSGVSVNQVIDERIAWISQLVPKGREKDGITLKMAPRKKAWETMASHLNRFIRPRLGSKIASEITKHDIAQLQADILVGTLIIKGGRTSKKGSISSAIHMRKAASGLFRWAAEAGRDYVTASPCVNLPALDVVPPRTRKLSPDEVRTLWHGLDRPDICADRKICLAIKYTFLMMLRTWEALGTHSNEFDEHGGLNSKLPVVIIPPERVKLAREIRQPLSDLAAQIAKEAMGNHPFLFAGRWGTEPLNKKAMACALRGNRVRRNGKIVTRTVGICEQLGMKPFTPHDLRRTAASLLAGAGVSRATIALCLDHQIRADDNGIAISPVTGRHYDQDPRIAEKREALQKLADEIRRIVNQPAEVQQADSAMRRAA